MSGRNGHAKSKPYKHCRAKLKHFLCLEDLKIIFCILKCHLMTIANNQKMFLGENNMLCNENVKLASLNSATFKKVFAHNMVVTFKF